MRQDEASLVATGTSLAVQIPRHGAPPSGRASPIAPHGGDGRGGSPGIVDSYASSTSSMSEASTGSSYGQGFPWAPPLTAAPGASASAQSEGSASEPGLSDDPLDGCQEALSQNTFGGPLFTSIGDRLSGRWWIQCPAGYLCPLSHFPIKLLPYPPFKLRMFPCRPIPYWLVDGRVLAMQVIVDSSLTTCGRSLQPSDIEALEDHIQKCKLGPFRPSRAAALASEAGITNQDPARRVVAARELAKFQQDAREELLRLRGIQTNRLEKLQRRTSADAHLPEDAPAYSMNSQNGARSRGAHSSPHSSAHSTRSSAHSSARSSAGASDFSDWASSATSSGRNYPTTFTAQGNLETNMSLQGEPASQLAYTGSLSGAQVPGHPPGIHQRGAFPGGLHSKTATARATDVNRRRWWMQTPPHYLCPLTDFPICLLPYPPFKLRLDPKKPGHFRLVDGKFFAMSLIVNANTQVCGHRVTPSDIEALDEYLRRYKLGPFRPTRVAALEREATTDNEERRAWAEQELVRFRRGAIDEMARVQRIQEHRLAELWRQEALSRASEGYPAGDLAMAVHSPEDSEASTEEASAATPETTLPGMLRMSL